MNLLIVILIGISLSMDTFSLSLSYGTMVSKKYILRLSTLVSFFHFFMPIFGNIIREILKINLFINTKIFTSIIFLYLAFNMLKDINTTNGNDNLHSIKNQLLFAIGVSVDSLGVGLTQNYNILNPIIYSICSFIFTFLGLRIGSFAADYLGKISIIFGIMLMLFIVVVNICLL